MSSFATFRARFRQMVETYGPLSVVVYFGMWIPLVVGFYLALEAGLNLDGWALLQKAPEWMPEWLLGAPELVAALVFAKLIKPLLVTITFIVTPMVARSLGRGVMAPAAVPDQDQ